MKKKEVILVDENDIAIGSMEKQKAHEKGCLHRAFSIFVLNDKKELLLQKRAENKYHSGGLWTNTCCSHPQPGETLKDAVNNRLMEEMGFQCPLEKAFSFTYRAEVDNNLTEHEFDHVFIGRFNDRAEANPEEVMDWKWMSLSSLEKDLKANPETYTSWLGIVYDRFSHFLKKSKDY